MFVVAKELVGVPGLPKTVKGIREALTRYSAGAEDKVRKRAGGKALEFHITVLPPEARAEVLSAKGMVETSSGVISLPERTKGNADSAHNFERQQLWKHWEGATNEQRQRAEQRTTAVSLVAELVDSGLSLRLALRTAAMKLHMSEGSLRNLYYRVQNRSRDVWAPVLLDRRLREKCKTNREAPISEDAWQFFLGDYLRPEEPCFTKSYELLQIAAREYDWEIPSERTLRRRVEREIDARVIVATRKGDNALARMFPSQQRTVAQLHAMEWINGDGYQHNVFVQWYNGEVIRPKTWVWQDVHSRKIIGWRTDVSENSDSIRLSLMDAISEFGKPEHVTIDNTRAAANKWLSGGVPNRYRFKVKPDDPMGILPMLGIQVHWTSVIGGKGWGQAKPIERAFGIGGLGDYIDKHPSLAGAYTGPNTQNKPDNYGDRVTEGGGGVPASYPGAAWFNMIQAELLNLCAAYGISPDKANLNQLKLAIEAAVNQRAPLASPAFSGVPTAPTASQSTNNTQIATTAFVKAALAALVDSSPAALDTLNELAAALGNDPNFATTMTNALANKQAKDATLTALSGKDVAGLLTYLDLGGAAKLNAAVAVQGASGYLIIPALVGGIEKNIIYQWGNFAGVSSGDTPVTFPIPFPNAVRQVSVSAAASGTGAYAGYNTPTKNGFNGNMWASSTVRQPGNSSYWAIGE